MCRRSISGVMARLALVWFPDPSVMRMRGRGKKGLGNNYTLARARGWNLKKVLVCAAIQTSARKYLLRVLYACLLVNIHDRVMQSANHSHLEVRASQIPGPVRESSSIVICQTLLSSPTHAHNRRVWEPD